MGYRSDSRATQPVLCRTFIRRAECEHPFVLRVSQQVQMRSAVHVVPLQRHVEARLVLDREPLQQQDGSSGRPITCKGIPASKK